MAKSSELSIEFNKIIKEYTDEIDKKKDNVLKAVGKEAANKLIGTSPMGHGSRHYASGWTIKQEKQGQHITSVTVHNKTKPGLAHLLENGHQLRQGGRAPAIKHIEPVESWAIQETETRMERELK